MTTPVPSSWTISVRTKPSLVRAARLFAADVARRHELSEPLIDDLKLAVAEAINLAVASGAASVEIRLTERDAGLSVEVSPPGVPGDDPVDGFEVIGALFQDAQRTEDAITFSVIGD